jgi:hypothetical protein
MLGPKLDVLLDVQRATSPAQSDFALVCPFQSETKNEVTPQRTLPARNFTAEKYGEKNGR